MLLLAIVLASIVLMLVRPRDIAEGYWVAAGAVLLVVLGLLPARAALRAVWTGNDVYLFLIAMMVLAELAREAGLFDWLAVTAVRVARGDGARLFALLYGVGVVVTACLSNDATAVVLTPAVAVAVRHAGAKARPYLFACALVANAASFVLPISNPANLVVYGTRMPTVLGWLAVYSLPSLLSIAATFAVLRFRFRRAIAEPINAAPQPATLSRGGKLVSLGLAMLVIVLGASSQLHVPLGLATFAASACIVLVVCISTRTNPRPLIRAVSWTTLLLVSALFVLVAATQGLIAPALERAIAWAAAQPRFIGSPVVAFAIALADNVLNNLPTGLVCAHVLAHADAGLAPSVLLGVDLGSNLAVTGSLATVLWLIALRREGERVGFWAFFAVGIWAMPIALAAALLATL